jgi:N-glycosylase/DNA lyase
VDYTRIKETIHGVQIEGVKNFDLDAILDCGQCFRWFPEANGTWKGIVRDKCRSVEQTGDILVIYGATKTEAEELWINYFDLNRDYGAVKDILRQDPTMRKAVDFTPGMRVLRQDPWETLCSFIISQSNNIKRIKGIVTNLCEAFGEPIDGGYTFPTAKKLSCLKLSDLDVIRSGFRAAYIMDAARLVDYGRIEFSKLREMPTAHVERTLMSIHGVGPKVASCTALFGLGKTDTMPVDVWIRRAMTEFYPSGIPSEIKAISGLGQQYLFHYMRNR